MGDLSFDYDQNDDTLNQNNEIIYNHQIDLFHNQHICELIFQHLDQKSLGRIACTCKVLKEQIYNPIYWKNIELPFLGTRDKQLHRRELPINRALELKIYSTLYPPAKNGLDELLISMMPSNSRFINTKTVQFKNFLFGNESILLASKLFPSLEKLDLDGGKITKEGLMHLCKFSKLRFLSIYCSEITSGEPDWLNPLESHLERLIMPFRPKVKNTYLLNCSTCRFYYNPKFNFSTSCLYHPKEYAGYGHSCSSFLCCGSNTPKYMGTPGCAYGYHTTTGKMNVEEDWLPEFYDVPYSAEIHGEYHFFQGRRSASTKETNILEGIAN